ncbi:hypothetical protein M426DRAFT_25691 [Hypoxylon sp. CI-4A]|nr:hypothetical protein M426DRAFT_25691 [Hypoxylon sp. CI-4A]
MARSDTESSLGDSQSQLANMLENNIAEWSDLNSEASTTEDEALEDHSPGQLCDVKTLYEGPMKCACCVNWVEEPPADLRPDEEEDESRRHALLVRLRRNHGEGKSMVLHSIVVQSSFLKSFLGQVFKHYSGITPALKKLVFKAPFHGFFYEWARLERMAAEVEEPTSRNHVRLMLKLLKNELKETISLSSDLNTNGVITYDLLWTIFKPGIDVYTFEDGYDRIYRLQRTQYVSGPSGQLFQLTLGEVETDGSTFGYQTKFANIAYFPGTRKVQDLEIFPASSHPRLGELKDALRKRGEMFRKIHLQDYFYCSYKGLIIDGKHKRNVEGRIVVDPSLHANFSDDGIDVTPFHFASLQPSMDVSDHQHRPDGSYPPPVVAGRGRGIPMGPLRPGLPQPHFYPPPPPNPPPPPPPGTAVIRRNHGAKHVGRENLTDDLLHLCTAYVRGYSFKTKKWVTFHVDKIREIEWHDQAFDSLVLDGGHKKLIKAFVESHVENKDRFDDVIEGKGQGICILLDGPPGVGKTLTAEAVSEKLRRPLYAMGAGELGDTPNSVEDNLQMILEAAAKWDAVLLLDECDVLLAERSADNLGRNSIVAIFLRLLEYYRGMLFMTTNRVEAIDPAFQSRIHLTIRYPMLNELARRQIWQRFVQTSHQESTLEPRNFLELQSVVVNGREIKNLVKTAQLLASHEKVPLSIEHIRTALSVSRAGYVQSS